MVDEYESDDEDEDEDEVRVYFLFMSKWMNYLTLSQTTNFRLFQNDRVCRGHFEI